MDLLWTCGWWVRLRSLFMKWIANSRGSIPVSMKVKDPRREFVNCRLAVFPAILRQKHLRHFHCAAWLAQFFHSPPPMFVWPGKMQCRTLPDILKEHGAPHFMDWLSLDVERAEMEILDSWADVRDLNLSSLVCPNRSTITASFFGCVLLWL